MKRSLIISYWIVSILLVAVVLTSVGYRFLEALFIGSMFLPGALAAKYFFPKVRGVKDTVFLVLGIMAGEMLLFLIAHYITYISSLFDMCIFTVYRLIYIQTFPQKLATYIELECVFYK